MPWQQQKIRILLVFCVTAMALVTALTIVSCKKNPPPPATSALASTTILVPDTVVHAAYAGSTSCKDCHLKAYDDWKNSHHGLAERHVQPDEYEQPFSSPLKLQHQGKDSQVFLDEKKFLQLITADAKGQPQRYPVTRIIGHNPLRQFLIPAPGNRLQTADITYDPHKNELFNVFGNDQRFHGDWGHWTGQGMNWNAMCAACHNTRLRKNFDPATNTYNTTMAEMAVSCESCHGPMKPHVDWQNQYKGSNAKDPTLKKLTRDQMLETCAPCHARRSEITGDMVPGESFFDHNSLVITDLSDLYHPDGTVRDENYETTSFLSSKMHHAGVRCDDCHDNHTGKTKLPGNALCLQCHASGGTTPIRAPIINPTAHSHHAEGSSGNDCISCHMPITTYMERHPRHDHSYSIPNPRLTIEHSMPNACNKCHTDKDPQWALANAKKWYGEKLEKPTHKRADIVARARRNDPNIAPLLIEMLRTEVIPTWQATACHLMAPSIADPAIRQALNSALKNTHPMVREAAIRSLTPLLRENHQPTADAIRPLLNDDSRSVRIAAAWALCPTLDLNSRAGKELVHMLDLHADQPTGRMQLSQFAYLRGNTISAISQNKQAIRMDPNSPPMHHDLAILLSTTGDTKGAVSAMQEACRLDPNFAEYHYKLGLAQNEAGNLTAAITSLEKSIQLDAQHPRANYYLGHLYNAQGKVAQALTSLAKAERLSPNDPSIPYTTATIHYHQGEIPQAQAALMRALQIGPQHAESRQLLHSLQAPRK